MTAEQRVSQALSALSSFSEADKQLPDSLLAEKLDQQTGCGWEAAILVAISSKPDFIDWR